MMKFKALILGCGAQGSVIASELEKHPEVTEIRVADFDSEKAGRLAKKLRSNKISAHRADASNIDEVSSLAKGVDVVVNAVIPRFNLNVMDAALKNKANYLDLAFGPPYENFEKELRRSKEFEDKSLTALICAGSSPGITDVLVAHAADRLERVNEVRIRVFDMVESKEMFSTWSPETMFGDMAEEPIVYQDGEFKRVPPFSGEEVYDFPDPFGPKLVVAHIHEEALMFPHFLDRGLRYFDFKIGSPDIPTIKSLVELGLCSDEPIDLKGVRVVPRDLFLKLLPPTRSHEEIENKIKNGVLVNAHQCYVVEVEGERAHRRLSYKYSLNFPSLLDVQKMLPGATHESYVTGVSAAIFTKMLGSGKIETKGVIAPECLRQEVREAFLTALAEKHIRISEKKERQLN